MTSTTLFPNPVPQTEIQEKMTREIVPIYWRRLIEVGIPIDAAQMIAWAIARYDKAKKLPPHQQQRLIRQYCHFICRAELWRSGLLLDVAV